MIETILISIVCVAILATIFCIWYFNPFVIFRRKFVFSLPKSAKIVNYKFDFLKEERLFMKIFFDDNDYKNIEEGLHNYFKKTQKKALIPAFYSTCSWWDMDEKKITESYHTFKSGKRAKTLEVYAFITKREDGKHFLYIVN